MIDNDLVCFQVHGFCSQHVIVGNWGSDGFESFKGFYYYFFSCGALRERVLIFNLKELIFEGNFTIFELMCLKGDNYLKTPIGFTFEA